MVCFEGTVDQLRIPVRKVGRGIGHPLGCSQQLVQAAFAVGEPFKRRLCARFERQRGELPRRLPKFLAQARVLIQQCAVFEDQLLTRDAFERRRLLVQQPARSPRLRRLKHFLSPLRFETVERQDQFGERVDERQADEQKAEQDELEERARVVHA